MVEKASFSQRWADLTFSKTQLFWSCAGAAVATAIVGFSFGGWVTGGTAGKMTSEAASDAYNRLASGVCVNRFTLSDDAAVKLVALKELRSWDRARFVEEGGWAKMPSVPTDISDRSASLCADQLAELDIAAKTAVQAQ